MDGHVSDYISERIEDVTRDWRDGRGEPKSWEDWRLAVEWHARRRVENWAREVLAHCDAEHPEWNIGDPRRDPVSLGAFLVEWLSTEIAEGMDEREWIVEGD